MNDQDGFSVSYRGQLSFKTFNIVLLLLHVVLATIQNFLSTWLRKHSELRNSQMLNWTLFTMALQFTIILHVFISINRRMPWFWTYLEGCKTCSSFQKILDGTILSTKQLERPFFLVWMTSMIRCSSFPEGVAGILSRKWFELVFLL